MTERNAQEDIKAHLIATNEEYRRLSDEHTEFAKKLDALEYTQSEATSDVDKYRYRSRMSNFVLDMRFRAPRKRKFWPL